MGRVPWAVSQGRRGRLRLGGQFRNSDRMCGMTRCWVAPLTVQIGISVEGRDAARGPAEVTEVELPDVFGSCRPTAS